MCGITGFKSNILNNDILVQMTKCLVHRGPNAEGHFFDL